MKTPQENETMEALIARIKDGDPMTQDAATRALIDQMNATAQAVQEAIGAFAATINKIDLAPLVAALQDAGFDVENDPDALQAPIDSGTIHARTNKNEDETQ